MTVRHTILVNGQLARREAMIEAARAGAHGRQILNLPQLAARLAGGFLQSVDRIALLDVLHGLLADPKVDLGGFTDIRELPGTARAAARTLTKAWAAGVDLQTLVEQDHCPRIQDIAGLEAAVLSALPCAVLRPIDLAVRALERIDLADRVLGPITVRSLPDLDPVWRGLLTELARAVPVSWQFEQYPIPDWINGTEIHVTQADDRQPEVLRISCANPRHEAIEALRWARELIASDRARPEEIGIAAPATAEWDQHVAAIAADANLPVAFVHGRPAMATRAGQAAAAVAEVMLYGLSRRRVRRALALIRGMTDATANISHNWQRILPADAPLLRREQWHHAIDVVSEWPEDQDFGADLRALIDGLAGGADQAADIGAAVLSGQALAIWQKGLNEGPAQALDVTLSSIRVDETLDPVTSIIWCSAADIAACPRPFVRFLGLTSRGWPRTSSEDPLLPAHVIEQSVLDPVPVPERDRRDFRTVLRAAPTQVVLSRFRRDAEGRRAGASALLRETGIEEEAYLRRERVPEHAASEADRLLARPTEFEVSTQAVSARQCWIDWRQDELTAHDGLIRPDHPVIERVMGRLYSASRLRILARDPLGFVWKYAFGWDAPSEDDEPLSLDPMSFGTLTHNVLELAIRQLEGEGGFGAADRTQIRAAIDAAVDAAQTAYAANAPVPPLIMWRRTLVQARDMALRALTWEEAPLPNQAAFAEVWFGNPEAEIAEDLPWDPTLPVEVPGTGLLINGAIDRLDLAGDRSAARVTDYKTGKLPKKVLTVNGGGELQRVLYAYAVLALLGNEINVASRLLYPRDAGVLMDLDDPRGVLSSVAEYLLAARNHLLGGRAFVGPDSGVYADNPLTFALPGNAKDIYLERKLPLVDQALAPLPELWEMP